MSGNKVLSESIEGSRELFVFHRGEGNSELPIVYIPGWGHEANVWRDIHLSCFSEHDAYFVDLPGLGVNKDLRVHSHDEFLQMLDEQLPALYFAMGWSLGGNLAACLAERHPDRVQCLLTFATNPCFVEKEDWKSAMAAPVFHDFCRAFDEDATKTIKRFQGLQGQGDVNQRKITKTLRGQTSPSEVDRLQWRQNLSWLADIDNRNFYRSTNVACMHFLGECDALVPSGVASELSRDGQSVCVIEGRGHCLLHAFDEQLQSAASDFVSRFVAQRDKRRVSRSFSRAASTYDQAARVQVSVGEKLKEIYEKYELSDRLSNQLSAKPQELNNSSLDLGCGTGAWFDRDLDSDRQNWFAVDIAEGMLKYARSKHQQRAAWICADAESLPFANNSFSGVVSNLALQWSEDLFGAFTEVNRVLNPGAWFLFTTLGEETLFELKQAWCEVDDYVHVNNFHTKDAVVEQLTRAGFAVKYDRVELEIAEYKTLIALMKDLKQIGAHNVNARQNSGLTSVKKLKALEASYEKFRQGSGVLPSTYEVIYILAEKNHL